MMVTRTGYTLGMAAAILLAGTAAANAQEGRAAWVKATLDKAKVGLAAVVETAQREVPGGRCLEVGLERAGEGVVYEVDLLVGEGLKKVQIDIGTGKVLKVWDEAVEEDEVEEFAGLRKAMPEVKVTPPQALEAAAKSVADGRPFKLELAVEHGQPCWSVVLLVGDKVTKVAIDAVAGKVLVSEKTPGKKEHEEPGKGGGGQKAHGARPAGGAFTETFALDPADLASIGRNPYFILEPGYTLEFAGKEHAKDVHLTITVLNETKKVAGVETRIVEERETVGGSLAEVSRNYFAISKSTASVFYFGEDSQEYQDGKVVSREGSWEAGKDGAQPGLMMPGTPLLGARYYQELAPKVAMDRAEIVSLTEAMKTPAGEFKNCLKTAEDSPLEPGSREYKLYAPGVGLIKDGGLVLGEVKR